MKSIFNYFLLISYFLVITTIYVGQFLGVTSADDLVERRETAKLPVINSNYPKNLSEVKTSLNAHLINLYEHTVINELNAYFLDNFGLRNIFLKKYLVLKLDLLKTNKVFKTHFNDQGMIFGALAPGQDYKRIYQRIFYTQDELNSFKEIFEREKASLDRQNIPYFLVIVPDRRVVYNHTLKFDDRISIARHNQFVNYMKEKTSLEIIDVTDAFLQSEKSYPLFFKTDSHWTNYGAFLAYKEIMTRLAKVKKIKTYTEEDFNISLEKYEMWLGDGGLNYPENPGRPEIGVKFKIRDNSVNKHPKLGAILEYGDSYLNIDRRVCVKCLINTFPEMAPLAYQLFAEPGSDKLIDPNPGYWLPKYYFEDIVSIIREKIPNKVTQDRIISYLMIQSIHPEPIGLDYFFRLSFDNIIRNDLSFKLDQSLVEQYKPDLVIREAIDNRVWEFTRVKCNYDRDSRFNNINSC